MFIESWGDDQRFPGLGMTLDAELLLRDIPLGGSEIVMEHLLIVLDPQMTSEDSSRNRIDVSAASKSIQDALRESRSAIAAVLDALPEVSDLIAAISPQYRSMREQTFIRSRLSRPQSKRSASRRQGRLTVPFPIRRA